VEVVERPFLTSQAVLGVLSFGKPTTDAPLRTLRRHAAVSEGWSVPMRSSSGRLIGRVHMHSALNADAARLFRWGQREAAVRMARKAQAMERSRQAGHVRRAIERTAEDIPVDWAERGATDHRTQAFRYYVDVRRQSAWEGLESSALWRAWVSEPQTWLAVATDESLREAVHELAEHVAGVRADEPLLERHGLTTRLGVIDRLDPVAAELKAPDGTCFVVPRRPLEREGLAIVGQPVSILMEELPGGRTVDYYAPAARLDIPAVDDDVDPFGASPPVPLSPADSGWILRAMASKPTVVPLAPVGAGGA